MEKVFVPNIDANQTMEIVRELRAKGLLQGRDFNFSYQQPKVDFFSNTIHQHKGCWFDFAEGKWATFFRMKYGK